MRIDPLKMSESNKMSKPNVHTIKFLHREQKRNLFRNTFKVSSLGVVLFICALSSVWMLSGCNGESNEGYAVFVGSCDTDIEAKRASEYIDLNWNDWQKQCKESCSGKLRRMSSDISQAASQESTNNNHIGPLCTIGVRCFCSSGE